MKNTFIKFAGAVAVTVTLLIPGMGRAVPVSSLPNVSLLTTYAEFGGTLVESAVTINGNVGVANGGSLAVNAPSTINGDVYRGTGASVSGPGTVTGTVHPAQDLSAVESQLTSASAAFAGSTADFTSFGTGNFSASAGNVTVVTLTSLNLNNQNINFIGAGYLVLNITTSFSLTGTASILGADPTHIFINYTGTSTLNTHVGDTIDGYVFDPNADANLDGTWFGGIYGGPTTTITLLSNAHVIDAPTTVPDNGSTLVLLGFALTGLGYLGRKFQFRPASAFAQK